MSDKFMSEDLIKTKITYRELFKRLWPYARKEKGLLIVALFAVVGVAVVSRMIPLVIGYAIDHGFCLLRMLIFSKYSATVCFITCVSI
jgi:ATP-binding cassette subfamily B multidrug efflux pump